MNGWMDTLARRLDLIGSCISGREGVFIPTNSIGV